jgi:hypothetical protein
LIAQLWVSQVQKLQLSPALTSGARTLVVPRSRPVAKIAVQIVLIPIAAFPDDLPLRDIFMS